MIPFQIVFLTMRCFGGIYHLEGRFSRNPQAIAVRQPDTGGKGSRKELYSALVKN